MGQNERLRLAMLKNGMTAATLAAAAGVDPKTCERWITRGRTPHRSNAARAAAALGEDVSYLWPDIERGRHQPGTHPDLVAIYPTRADAPLEAWLSAILQVPSSEGVAIK